MKDYILITGGHHSSAIPLIQLLKKNNFKIKFIGHKYASVLNKFVSSEFTEITNLGVDYIDLKSPKFYSVSGFSKYLKLIFSTLFCIKLFIAQRPRLVVSYGGYLAVPVVLAARILFIKSVTHEQTLTVGMANRLIGKLVNKVFVSWRENLSSNDPKYLFVGLPLRAEIKNVAIKKLNNSYKLNTLFIQGGKQGSHILNQFVFDNIEYLAKNFKIYHQTSKHSANNDHIQAKNLSKKYKNYKPFEFIFGSDYTTVLDESDFILSRSGAHMVYEMAFLKMPSIFVPIPWASQNEQYINAENAHKYCPSVILEEKNLALTNFCDKVEELRHIAQTKAQFKDVEPNSDRIMFEEILKI